MFVHKSRPKPMLVNQNVCLQCVCLRHVFPAAPSFFLRRSKRKAFELLWKWSMSYGLSRCGLTWFGFNTSLQEVHKASRFSFVVSHLSLRANGPLAFFAHHCVAHLLFIYFQREHFHMITCFKKKDMPFVSILILVYVYVYLGAAGVARIIPTLTWF